LNTFILSKSKELKKLQKWDAIINSFGVVLAVRGLTLGTSGASEIFPDANAWDGLNFFDNSTQY
jgi:hypothetical protein